MAAPHLDRDVDFQGWPALRLTQGPLALHLVPALGGRIMGIAFEGRELAFQQPERRGQVPDVAARADLESWRARLGFPLWGGGKTWLAPERAFPGGVPPPDLDSGAYAVEVLETGSTRLAVAMTSGVCRDTGLQIRRTISMRAAEPGWRVTHAAVNRGTAPWTGGLWDVLMLLRPATVLWPARDLHVFPDKADPGAGRAALEEGMVHCNIAAEFKIGARLDAGWLAAKLAAGLGYLRRFDLPAGAAYAHGWPAEVYNAGRYPYCEVETHGPEVTLPPGTGTTLDVTEQVAPWPAIAAALGVADGQMERGEAT